MARTKQRVEDPEVVKAREERYERSRVNKLIAQTIPPVTDSNGKELAAGQICEYRNRHRPGEVRGVEVMSVSASVSQKAYSPYDSDVWERHQEHDQVYIKWGVLTSPTDAPNVQNLMSEVIGSGVWIGYSQVESSCHPTELTVITDPDLLHRYHVMHAKARVRGIDYQIDQLQVERIEAVRQLRDIEGP